MHTTLSSASPACYQLQAAADPVATEVNNNTVIYTSHVAFNDFFYDIPTIDLSVQYCSIISGDHNLSWSSPQLKYRVI